ncbi:hypothetical protein SAMN05660971_00861 [Halomonas cupida]|uniref:Uncharacterized protein n=1 Tax=Halomonas cupida TaxID=44933 RepID=A0A1M7BWM8_9GAMM|nr:hypothetical protein SAMN05660971_00861 [Halomonas cupida]
MAYATISLNTINTNATTRVVALVFFGIANSSHRARPSTAS